MAKYLGSTRIGERRLLRWTQMQCDGCGELGGETYPGLREELLPLPDGWDGGIEAGMLRCHCPKCQGHSADVGKMAGSNGD